MTAEAVGQAADCVAFPRMAERQSASAVQRTPHVSSLVPFSPNRMEDWTRPGLEPDRRPAAFRCILMLIITLAWRQYDVLAHSVCKQTSR